MESNPLRGLFGVSSPRTEAQRVAPQPTETTENENVYFEIPSGMLEKLLANPFAGDGTKHPDEHLIYVDEVCGLFNLAGISLLKTTCEILLLLVGFDTLTYRKDYD